MSAQSIRDAAAFLGLATALGGVSMYSIPAACIIGGGLLFIFATWGTIYAGNVARKK